MLVDVRTPSEFRSQHVQGSINLPLESFKAAKLPFKRETAIHVVCQSGGRSAKFCDRLREVGYLSVYDADGGIDAWKASGMELVGFWIAPEGVGQQQENELEFINCPRKNCCPKDL